MTAPPELSYDFDGGFTRETLLRDRTAAPFLSGPRRPSGNVVPIRAANDEWRQEAVCRLLPADEAMRLFFPATGRKGAAAAAIAICHQCPVRTPCLEDALADRHAVKGIRGGLSARHRDRIKIARRPKP